LHNSKKYTYCMQKVLNVAFSMTENDGVCTQSIIDQANDDILHENERNYKNRLSLLIGTPFFLAEREGFVSAIFCAYRSRPIWSR
jgi:hypothetical protein